MIESLFDTDWLAQLASYQRLWVGFSGGLDSTVLLHGLAGMPGLASKLSAIHIHHGLSSNADSWLEHCQDVCSSLAIPLVVRFVAIEQRSNIEEQARQARYAVFETLVSEHECLLVAHHADDQAETLLLQILRGAGIDGLAAMPEVKAFGSGELLRPLLQHSRVCLETYALSHRLSWIDDESNQDSAFSRNYLRHQIMPLLQARWPGAVANLGRTAKHCQQAKANLQALAQLDCVRLTDNTLSISGLDLLRPERIANVLRIWLNNNQVRFPATDTFNRIMNEVIHADRDAMPCVEWGEVCVRRYQDTLYILKDKLVSDLMPMAWSQFPTPLLWGNHSIVATLVDKGLHIPPHSRVSVRLRQGGELFSWHGQTKVLKKLLQEWHIPPWQRDTLPLIYVDDELAAVVGFAVSDRFYKPDLAYTYQIELH